MFEQNGTGQPSQAQIEAAQIQTFGECRRRSRLAGRPLCHDWHPAGTPIQTPQSVVLARVCCYCAPEGVMILVRTTISEQQIQSEATRHGPRLVFEQVVQRGSGIVLPGQEGFVIPPGTQ
jgi:hypothetical protein